MPDPVPLPRQADADQVERAKALLDSMLVFLVPVLTPITGEAGLQAFVAGRLFRAQQLTQRGKL